MIELVMIKMLGCGPCKYIEPVAKDIAEKNSFKFRIIINEDMSKELRPHIYPYFYIYKDGNIMDHWGGVNKNKIEYKIKNYNETV